MKRLVFVFLVLFYSLLMSGFEMNYTVKGSHIPDLGPVRTTDPRHEEITENAFKFLCQSEGVGADFIDSYLREFLDVTTVNSCGDINDDSLFSVKRGVRYNDVPEVDGFSAMNNHDLAIIYGHATGACVICAPVWATGLPCPTPEIDAVTGIALCVTLAGLTNNEEMQISDEIDLSNEAQYPLMHAQLNNRNFGSNPHYQIEVLRNYVKRYFYELLFLSFSSGDDEPENKFVSYTDVDQHDSGNANEFIKSISYRKILMGELFHIIEDSFAHNLRYLGYLRDEGGDLILGKDGNEIKVINIGAVLNMETSNYNKFGHGDDFGPKDWNCEEVDDTANWSDIENIVEIPVDFENISDYYFEVYDFGLNYGRNFISSSYASTMASHAVAEFLWRLGKAVSIIKASDFDGVYDINNNEGATVKFITITDEEGNEVTVENKIYILIEDYLDRWFTDGTDIFQPNQYRELTDEYDTAYSEIITSANWENFYNVDLWSESGTDDAENFDALFLPWVFQNRRYDVSSNSDRFVYETVENLESHPKYNSNSNITYDSESKIMKFQRSNLTVMWSWVDGNDRTTVDLKGGELEQFYKYEKYSGIGGYIGEKLVPIDRAISNLLPENNRSAAAVFIPRGFRACFHYEADGVQSFSNNDAAKFFKMPTYRCFYGGKEGRLVGGGKEDALKPGTKVYLYPIDPDGDGILIEKDNCPGVYNPGQENWNGDRKGDACDDWDGDGWKDDKDACPDARNEVSSSLKNFNCRGSNSDECLEARKVCDIDNDGRWDFENNENYEIDNYLFYSRGWWEKEGGTDVNIVNCNTSTFTEFCVGDQYMGETLYVSHNAGYFCRQDYEEESKSVSYFCYCGKTDFLHGKCDDDGGCGPSHAEPLEPWDTQNGRPTWLPVKDSTPANPVDWLTIENELSCKYGEKIKEIKFGYSWEYQNNPYLYSDLHDGNGESTVPKVESEEERDELINEIKVYPMIKLSQAASQIGQTYVPEAVKIVNRNYFSNNHQGHIRPEYNSGLKLADKMLNIKEVNEDKVDLIIVKSPWVRAQWIPGFPDWYWQMMSDYIGRRPWDGPMPWEAGVEEPIKNNLYETLMRPADFSKVKFDGEDVVIRPVHFGGDYNQIFDFNGKNAVYFSKNNEQRLAFSDISGVFKESQVVFNGVALRSPAVAVKGNEIFMASSVVSSNPFTSLEVITQNSLETTPERNTVFVKISFTANGAQMTVLEPLPSSPRYISLFEIGGKIYSFIMDLNGVGEILEYNESGQSWVVATSFNYQTKFSLNNMFVEGNTLYFTAPGVNNQNVLNSWDKENGIQEVSSLSINYDPSVKPFIYEGQIVLADLKDISGTGVKSWYLTESGFEETFIGISKSFGSDGPCLKIEGNNASGGRMIRGECRSFEQKIKRDIYFGETVKAVEGKGDLLVVATYSKIKIYNNENPESMALLYEKNVYGPVKDLEIIDNKLFAAVENGIDAVDLDTFSYSHKATYGTTGAVKEYKNNLYVGDGQGIKIVNPDTLDIVHQVNTSGDVKDIEIIGDTLYVLEWAGLKRYNAETLEIIPTSGFYFDGPEMVVSENRLYINKNGNVVRLDFNGENIIETQFVGDFVELRDSYTYLDETYFPDGTTLRVSSMEPVPAPACGNGVVESGETCDGNSVACTSLNGDYTGGTATCNSTCDGYNENNCEEDDGW